MNSDFVNWNDLDLDFFLGENWTDDEENDVFGPENEIEMEESSGCDDELQHEEKNGGKTPTRSPSKKTGKENKPTRIYRCPECQKDYKSSSGFRGHVSKKHNRHDLKG